MMDFLLVALLFGAFALLLNEIFAEMPRRRAERERSKST